MLNAEVEFEVQHSLQHSTFSIQHFLPWLTTNSFAGTRIWRNAPATCGAIFDAARPAVELAKIEERVSAPDFWKDQASAQKLLQRRRRLEEDVQLSESLQRKLDDLARARRMGAGRASRSPTTSAAPSTSFGAGRCRRDQEDARRRARSQERHRHDSPGRRRHRVAGLGRDAPAHVPALDRAPRLQARGHRPPARRRGRHQERDAHRPGRVRLRTAAGRSRRAPARAHLAVRPGVAPSHLVRVGVRLAGAARGRRDRDRGQGPAHRHVSLERRRRPARQRHRLRRPPHAPADRHRRVVPERALAAPQPRLRDARAQGAGSTT